MTYKVIIRDPEAGTEEYVEDLSKHGSHEEAEKRAADSSKKVYVEWTDTHGKSGYMNRDGGMDCPGEPW